MFVPITILFIIATRDC